MQELLEHLDAAFASAVVVTMIGSGVVVYVIMKILDAIAVKSKKLDAFLKGKVFKALKPVYPILIGCGIGVVAFNLISGDSYIIGFIKGMVCGSFSDTVYHVVTRYIKLSTDNGEK